MSDQIIYKFKLEERQGLQAIKMPAGSLVLSCQVQQQPNTLETIHIWAQTSKSMDVTWDIEFYLAYTGEVLPDNNWRYHFLNTVQLNGLVYHVFHVKKYL